ncbi:hypothetical protein K7432_006084 [Basidiobolus ranarum]|uniref:G-protein coupled receptors family 2 profile 2 domain-containing protein n=1 Tax=Basidiobolus ranarum TaxID=34480 RepID=A0ABR2WVH3_9FUNG
MVDSWDYDPGYDLVLKGDYENRAVTIINVVLNSASIVCGSLVLIIYFSIRSIEPKLMDRVSLRLTAAISAVDVLKAIVYILFTFVSVSGPACDFSAWAIIFLTNYYIFLTCMIAFNLQYVFLHNKPYYPGLERIYFTVSLLFALATTVPAWAAGRMGWDDNVGVCWWRNYSSKRTQAWEWGSFLFWIVSCSLYCLVIVILVIMKLEINLHRFSNRNKNLSLEVLGSMDERSRKTQKTIKRLVARIALYTLIPLATQGGFVLMELWLQFKHEMNTGINYWSVIGTDLPGVLNLAAFLMDPALHNSVATVREKLICMYCSEEVYSTTTIPLKKHSSESEYYRTADHSTYTRFMKWFVSNFLGSEKRDITTGSTFYPISANHHSLHDSRDYYGPTHLQMASLGTDSLELGAISSGVKHPVNEQESTSECILPDQSKIVSREEREKLGKFIRGL